eukprot:2897070-Pleurochrysis_carterae.AAC.1
MEATAMLTAGEGCGLETSFDRTRCWRCRSLGARRLARTASSALPAFDPSLPPAASRSYSFFLPPPSQNLSHACGSFT